MKPDVTLCEGLRSGDLAIRPIEIDSILDWYDGAITAVVRCSQCSTIGLIEMVDWSRRLNVRIYALSGLESGSLRTYEHNVARGSCDLARRRLEEEALLASTGPPERLLALDVRSNSVVAAAPWPSDLTFPVEPWRERVPSADDASWFSRVGLDKSSA